MIFRTEGQEDWHLPIGGAPCGYGCDEIVFTVEDFEDMMKVPPERLKDYLMNTLYPRFNPKIT